MDRITDDGNNENISINLRKEFITKENIIDLFSKYNLPSETNFNINLLSVDIDFNDYYCLQEILKLYKCDIIICEYKSTKVKYCSTKCYGIARRKVVTISCYNCKKSFDIKPSLVHKQQFCSLLCWNNFKTTSIIKKCECCNTDFTVGLYKKEKAKYCSSECFGISAQRRCQLLCEVCGNIFSVPNSRSSKSKYCSRKCSSQSRKLAL